MAWFAFYLEKPGVDFNTEAEAVYDTKVVFKATIRSFLKRTRIIWRKGMTIIDIKMPKYEGSSDVGSNPVLCINNVNEKDEDVYQIDVNNEWGTTTRSSNRLKVIGSKNPL